MNISEKFEKGKESRTYQRIDSEYHVNIFLGYNEDGNMSLVITEPGKPKRVSSSKIIRVNMSRRIDQKIGLEFELLDKRYNSLFMVFCKDMIVSCEKAGSSLAISNAVVRWKYWKNMFENQKAEALDKNKVKGLIGELIVLKEHLASVYGINDSVSAWMGPLLGHKDFEISNTWYEVKSISDSALQVQINSLEQLDSEADGHLVIVRLDETSLVNKYSVNLNTLITSISESISDAKTMELFVERLNLTGYLMKDEYDDYNYTVKGLESYSVTKEFPCLKKGNVPSAVGKATYHLIVDSLKKYREF